MKQYFAFQWHITDDCDQHCKHCYIFAENTGKKPDSMTWEQMQEVVANCEDFCTMYGRWKCARCELKPWCRSCPAVACDRNIVEGEFGVGKRAYGLNRIMAHLPETSVCVIGVALLCMNLAKRLRSLCFDLLCLWITKLASRLAVQVAA